MRRFRAAQPSGRQRSTTRAAGGSVQLNPRVARGAVTVADALLRWHRGRGRTFLWHSTAEAFVVVCAEVLLRQTRAASVEETLQRLLGEYPTPDVLASASEADVAAVIKPLGFSNQRAGQLIRMAKALVEDYGGAVPLDVADLQRLPGVGPYTAAVIASTLTGRANAAVDENVARVVARVFGLQPSNAEPRKSANLWGAAARLAEVRPEAGARLTWAMVELGTYVCRRRTPTCDECPLSRQCVAYPANASIGRRS